MWSRVSTVGRQGSIYAAINCWGKYLEIQPNLTLLLPLSERDKISNRKTTNRKPKIFWPFFGLWKNYNSSLRDFFMWPSKFYQRCCKHLNLPAICLSCLLRIEYLFFFFFSEGTVTNPAIWLVLYPVSIFLSLLTGHGNTFVSRGVHPNFRCHFS